MAFTLRQHIKEDYGEKRAMNLKGAKHRLESYVAPMGRVIDNIRSVYKTAQSIARQTSKAAAADARSWLDSCDGKLLYMVGLLTDAHDDAMALLRSADNEQADPAELGMAVHDFLCKATKLYLNKGITELNDTYSKKILDELNEGALARFEKDLSQGCCRPH